MERTGSARRGPLLVAGRRAGLSGDQVAGVRRGVLDGRVVLSDLQAGLPGARRVRALPGMVRRQLGDDDGVHETWLAFREIPGALVQWARAEGAAGPLRERGLELRWEVPLPTTGNVPEDPAPGGRLLEVASEVGRATFLLDPPPERWRVELSQDGAGLRVEARLGEAPAATLVVALGDPGSDAGVVLRRLEHLSAEVRGWAAETAEGNGRIRLHLPDGDESRALAWALTRLDSLPVTVEPAGGWDPADLPDPGADAGSWLRIADGLVAAGSFGRARSLLSSLAASSSDGGAGEEGFGGPGAAPYLLLLARYLRWSGARSLPDRASPVVEAVRERLLRPADRASWRERVRAEARALEEVADALDEPGGAADAVALREDADAVLERLGPIPPATPSGGGMRLPVLGAGAPSAEDGEPGTPRPWSGESPARADAAFRAWRRLLLAGVEGSGGLWTTPPDERGVARPDPLGPARAVAGLVFGLLGARADAAFGRLTLAPWIPEPWQSFEVAGLRMGDLRVGLRYRRKGARHTFVLAPTAGRVPPNLVFEPVVPATGVSEVRVDGEPADVDVDRRAGGSGVRLQLPLDSTREVSIAGDEQA